MLQRFCGVPVDIPRQRGYAPHVEVLQERQLEEMRRDIPVDVDAQLHARQIPAKQKGRRVAPQQPLADVVSFHEPHDGRQPVGVLEAAEDVLPVTPTDLCRCAERGEAADHAGPFF